VIPFLGCGKLTRKRHQRSKHEVISPWPAGHPSPESVAERVRYVGSGEHKDYESPAGPASLRSDAARCEPRFTDFEPLTVALQDAVRHRCVGAHFEGEFPRHVWGWLGERLYEARLVNRVQGWYKAWPIDEAERPRDDESRLDYQNG